MVVLLDGETMQAGGQAGRPRRAPPLIIEGGLRARLGERDGRAALGGQDHKGGLAPIGRVEPTSAFADVPVDGVAGNAQPPADLLGTHVLGDEAQAFTLARRQSRDGAQQGGVRLAHG